MNIKTVSCFISQYYSDVVSDIVYINDETIFCVWYGTIPSKIHLVHNGLIDITSYTVGYLRSDVGSLKPEGDWDNYCALYAKKLLTAFNEYCLAVLPDKYLLSFREGLISDKSIVYDYSDNDLISQLMHVFGSNISRVNHEGNTTRFVIYETLCFEIERQNAELVVFRIFREGVRIKLYTDSEKNNMSTNLISFLKGYSDLIIPDEWLVNYAT
ncbi:MAG: hypothetical protein IKF31_07410 [Clostridiales bacterium]|nr:hypothetical protein [Clostridiales bacterium]MBR4342893.1 hypothetical protein [Lachnospiraceae bacterium]